ncbi:MAG: 30S ribosomal protein S9 [Planctomycetota bacterium]
MPADAHGWWWGVGRRKAAVARVRIKPTSSDAKVQVQVTRKQFKSVDEYWPGERDRFDVFSPLRVTDTLGKLDVFIRCDGGGTMGQAQAARLGIARALVGYDPQLENVLREHGFLTRDARKVERKKYGQPGARRRYQFSKR